MKRSSSHRAAAAGRRLVMGLVVLVLLVAGAWASWETAHHIVLAKGRDHGTVTVTGCGEERCTGAFTPDPVSGERPRVTVDRSVAAREGDRFPVVVKPGSDAVVRTGLPGFLHAWVPLAGALVLAAFVIGGGLRMARTAWGFGAAGAVLLVATFVAL